MAVIQPLAIEEALQKTLKVSSERSIVTRRIVADAEAVIQAINEQGAAIINLGDEDVQLANYIGRLRAALRRKGHTDVLLRKQRSKSQLRAWRARPEDMATLDARRQTGTRLGSVAKAKAATRRQVLAEATRVAERAGA